MTLMRGIMNTRELGDQLRAARLRAELSQAALAARAGISRPTLRQIEAGHPTGEIGKAQAVIAALGLQLRLEPAEPSEFDLGSLDADTIPL